MLAEVKPALRVTTNEFDAEIQGLIDAAIADLILSGVIPEKAQSTTDPLIKRAVVTYCKAHFGYDNPDADRFARAYDLLKQHLSLAEDYNSHTVTFTVTAGGQPVDEATITAGGISKLTNSQGIAVFTTTKIGIDFDYVISKNGYQTVTGSIYVDGSKTVEVALNAV